MAHDHSLYALLPAGLAKCHNLNPNPALKTHQLYCMHVLLNSFSALILNKNDYKLLSIYYRKTLQCLMRLYTQTHPEVLYFLSGNLPILAQTYVKLFIILFTVAQLEPSLPLYQIGLN